MKETSPVSIQKKALFAIFIISILLVFSVFFGFALSDDGRDVSWIDNVENYIEEVRPAEPIESWDLGLYGYYFELWENGEMEHLYHVKDRENSNDSFVIYLEDILSKANNVLNSSVDEEIVEEIIQNNRFLEIFGQDFGVNSGHEISSSFSLIRFIIEDNLNKNLEGTILLKVRTPSGEPEMRLLEIKK